MGYIIASTLYIYIYNKEPFLQKASFLKYFTLYTINRQKSINARVYEFKSQKSAEFMQFYAQSLSN